MKDVTVKKVTKEVIKALLRQTDSEMMRIGFTSDGEVYACRLTESEDFYEPWDEEYIELN